MVNQPGARAADSSAAVLIFVCFASLFGAPLLSAAQRTVVQDAGGGRKQELVYDASDRVVEIRTLSPDGTVLVRNSNEYRPGFYVPQQTTVSYWPDGKAIKLFSRTTYDENSNFTGEVVETYNEVGKHVSGHKLVHDPQTGVYECWNWNPISQKYDHVECPSGEESSEPLKHGPRISRAQASRLINQARQAATADKKTRNVRPAMPTPASAVARNAVLGIVLPSHAVPGEHLLGTVVNDPERYDFFPDLTVIRITLPSESDALSAPPAGWQIQVADSKPQPADSPFRFTVPADPSQVRITMSQSGNPAKSATQVVSLAQSSRRSPSHQFEAPAVIAEDDVCEVSGHFVGNDTFASVDAHQAPVVAETEHSVYLLVPEFLDPGQHSLIVADGPTLVAFPVTLAKLEFTPQQRELKAGESILIIARLSGGLPDDAWRAGVFPPSNLERARKLVPGFTLPDQAAQNDTDENSNQKPEQPQAQDPKEKEDRGDEHVGAILLVLKNGTPENVSLRGSSNQGFSFTLKPEAFEQGDFVYKFVVTALQSGTFAIRGTIIPFLAPSTAQPFSTR
ncbi:MAG TPA: hypothetical protein VE994_20040 [Terriglobales bacterium]|nr:hypothetical protein [Terriglobales bacterium]